MKQTILAMMLLLSTVTAVAQDAKRDSVNERFFNAKVRELVYRLNITDEQKEKFVPVYRKYNDEMHDAWGGMPMMRNDGKRDFRKAGPKGEAKDGKNADKKDGKKAEGKEGKRNERKAMSSADVAKVEKQRIERQQRVQNVQMKYIDEFAKVLDGKQMKNFFEVENRIQKKLMERRMKPKAHFDKNGGRMKGNNHEARKQKKDK